MIGLLKIEQKMFDNWDIYQTGFKFVFLLWNVDWLQADKLRIIKDHWWPDSFRQIIHEELDILECFPWIIFPEKNMTET